MTDTTNGPADDDALAGLEPAGPQTAGDTLGGDAAPAGSDGTLGADTPGGIAGAEQPGFTAADSGGGALPGSEPDDEVPPKTIPG